jgi:hypothetical protein
MAGMNRDLADAYAAALDTVLRGAHLMAPDSAADLATQGAAHLGAETAVLWLVDYEQTLLYPVLGLPGQVHETLSIDGSVAGRAFRASELVETDAVGGRRLWVPLLDGVERLGVLELGVPGAASRSPEDLRAAFSQLAHLLAELLVSNSAYTDHYEWVRRRRRCRCPRRCSTACCRP